VQPRHAINKTEGVVEHSREAGVMEDAVGAIEGTTKGGMTGTVDHLMEELQELCQKTGT